MHDSIYEPAEDSHLVVKHIKDYKFNNALDMGTGSGIIAEELIKYCDDVVAVDLNPEAIKFCKKSFSNVKYLESDLFSNVEGKYDLITFNAPYLPHDKGIDDIALYGGKEGYEIIEKFLKDAKNFLNEKGKILMIFTSLSKPEKIISLMEEGGYVYKKVDQEHYFFEDIFLYEIKHDSKN